MPSELAPPLGATPPTVHSTSPGLAPPVVPAAPAAALPAVVGREGPPRVEIEISSAPLPIPGIAIEHAPGRFETDADLGMHRKLYDAPHRRREFIVYVPAGWTKEVRAPLIVLCHGCKQTPEEFAKGSRIADLADRLGCLVLIPRQTKWANPWRCWNWFDPSMINGGGEAKIVMAQVRFIRHRYRADPRRIMAVGISAGAALAVVLGIRYSRYVRAVVSHAGIACGAASSPMNANDVMRRGPNTDVDAIGAEARAKPGISLPVPLLAIHGDNDTVISPANSIALIRQYLQFNGHPAVMADTVAPGELPSADRTVMTRTADGRDVTTREWRIDGRLVARHVAIAGLGHAWSGGDDALAFNDRGAPDSSQLIGEFLHEVLP